MNVPLGDWLPETLIAIACLLAILAAIGCVVVLVLARQTPSSADPQLLPMDPGQLPPRVQGFLDEQARALRELGFHDLTRLTLKQPAVLLHSVVLCRPDDHVSASAWAICGPGNKVVDQAVSFRTELQPGQVLKTSNERMLLGLMPPTGALFTFPAIHDLSRLYRIHQALVRRAAGPARPLPPPSSAEEVIDSTRRYVAEDYQAFARAGYLRATDDGTVYRPTWKGAAVLVLSVLPPVDRLRRAIHARRTRKLLESLNV